jgi:hypothetical protein
MKDRMTAIIPLVETPDAVKFLISVMSQGRCPQMDMAPVSASTSGIPVHLWI